MPSCFSPKVVSQSSANTNVIDFVFVVVHEGLLDFLSGLSPFLCRPPYSSEIRGRREVGLYARKRSTGKRSLHKTITLTSAAPLS